jgi:hypothetical protein
LRKTTIVVQVEHLVLSLSSSTAELLLLGLYEGRQFSLIVRLRKVFVNITLHVILSKNEAASAGLNVPRH